jgi:type I restriction enzyme R subunit
MSAQQFMEALFGNLPAFFKNEEGLRALWSRPDTLRKLLEGLAEKGLGKDQLAEMQKIIDAEKSDLFDVLAHYVTIGVEELDQAKLNPLLRLRYNDSLADAVTDLGRTEGIGRVFSGFQQYLYRQQATV